MVFHLPETLLSSAKHYAVKHRSNDVGPVSPSLFETILDQYDHDVAYLHVGLSDIKTAFETNPYEFLLEQLDRRFESLVVPGFTKSFRETGEFDVTETTPELGAFSKLFFDNDCDYRTPDPLHSLQVKGPYRFDGCDFRNTFGSEGCYAQLEADDVLCLNVGTPWLISTQLHYLEQTLDVPYVGTDVFTGRLTYADGRSERISQTNYSKNNYVYFWDRLGIRDDMVAQDRMDHFELNGLNVMAFSMADLRELVERKTRTDPYYLVR